MKKISELKDQAAEWEMKSSNFSVNAGLGLTIATHFQVTANYNVGIGKTGDITWKGVKESVENHKTIEEALEIATEFTHRTIQQSFEQKLPQKYGVCFEPNIPWLIKKLDL